MQQALLDAAAAAGATVRRGITVTNIEPGDRPVVKVRGNGGDGVYTARLVVGADGRDSACRAWAGFQAQRDPPGMAIAGVLLEAVDMPSDTTALFIHPNLGQLAIALPVGGGRVRAYMGMFQGQQRRIVSGRRGLPPFLEASVAAGLPAHWYVQATPAGPLACYDGADRWVKHPYRNGVVLIGDAAASSDPSFGCGLSLTLRDVRVLREQLLAHDDWNEAAHAYAAEHDRYYGAVHRLANWMRPLFYDPSPEATMIRARALPRLAEDPTRRPDLVGMGPEFPSDETACRRLFGED